MVTDTTYEACVPTLNDTDLEEEERTQKVEQILRHELGLTGKTLEDAVLDVLWQHRNNKNPKKSKHPTRNAIARASSPSPWQPDVRSSTPTLAGSPILGRASPAPAPRSSFGGSPAPAFIRSKSFGTSSPFSSPRPSPRMAFAAPIVPHSPTLSNYEFSENAQDTHDYGDYGSDTVDWLVNDGLSSRPSSSGGGSVSETTLNAAAAPWIQPQANEMSSYDILRSVMGEGKSDEEIEAALESNGFDLSSAIVSLMGSASPRIDQSFYPSNNGQILIGKSMEATQGYVTEDQSKSTVLCKYWLTHGTCLRADCKFSHDLGGHICKYWLAGSCLAGESCLFSHDPSLLMNRINLGDSSASIQAGQMNPTFQIHDDSSFPTLQSKTHAPWPGASGGHSSGMGRQNSSHDFSNFAGSPRRAFEQRSSRIGPSFTSTGSRPTSRHRTPQPQPTSHGSIPLVDDSEAFPSLATAGVKMQKKHHGKRGGHNHGHANKENTPSLISDIVKMSPGPSPASVRKAFTRAKPAGSNSAAASAIPAPQHIPWLETGAKADQEYIKARQDAFKHGALRNKFLQSAAQAWNRNDARAAKALSLRGQSENDLMRKAHREAARVLYDSRNKDTVNFPEIYVDLHGLHPDEAINFLEDKLVEQQKSGRMVYAITGTGHHSKNGKDKVGKAVRNFLTEWKYAFREFSAAGAEGMGGILGINPASFDKSLLADRGDREGKGEDDGDDGVVVGGSTKVRVVKAVNSMEKGDDRDGES